MRLAKFLSIDPLAPKYPFYSPYAFSGNRVIDAVELEGLEPVKGKDNTWGLFLIFGGRGHVAASQDQRVAEPLSEPKAPGWELYPASRNANWTPFYAKNLRQVTNILSELIDQDAKPKIIVIGAHGSAGCLYLDSKDPNNESWDMGGPYPTGPESAGVKAFEIENYLNGTPEELQQLRDLGYGPMLDAVANLETIFAGIETGGTCVFATCNSGWSDHLGSKLVELGRGRINILLNVDRSRIPDEEIGNYLNIRLSSPSYYQDGWLYYPSDGTDPEIWDDVILDSNEGAKPLQKYNQK